MTLYNYNTVEGVNSKMGKHASKNKQKTALRVMNSGSGTAKPKVEDIARVGDQPKLLDPKIMRKVTQKKAEKAIKSNFQQQVLSLHERNYRTGQFGKQSGTVQVGSNPHVGVTTSSIQIAAPTFIAPMKKEENVFAVTDSLFLSEKESNSQVPVISDDFIPLMVKKTAPIKPNSNNPFQGLDSDDDEPTMTIQIANPTFSFSSSRPDIRDEDI